MLQALQATRGIYRERGETAGNEPGAASFPNGFLWIAEAPGGVLNEQCRRWQPYLNTVSVCQYGILAPRRRFEASVRRLPDATRQDTSR